MELIYTASSSLKKDFIFDSYPFLVSLSSKNVLAFCTIAEIDENKKTSPRCSIVTEYYIYVCDIDKPWYAHKLTSSNNKIVSLEWHPQGLKLFYADDEGNCYVCQMKNLLNIWEQVAHVKIKGHVDILQVVWLQHERKITFLADKKDSPSYYEKFQTESVYNPFFFFDSDGNEGILIVTSSHLVLLVVPDRTKSPTSEVGVISGPFTKVEAMRRVSDVWLAEDKILIASCFGLSSSAVRCHSVTVEESKKRGEPQLRCEPMLGFSIEQPMRGGSTFCSPPETSRRPQECPCPREVIFLRFLSSDSILVSYNSDDGSGHVEVWRLAPDKVPSCGFFRKRLPPDHPGSTEVGERRWTRLAVLSHSSHVTSIAVPRLKVVQQQQHHPHQQLQQHQQQLPQEVISYNNDNNESFVQYVAVAYKDGSAKLANRQTFLWMATTHLDTGNMDDGWGETTSTEKRARPVTPRLVHMQQSFTGCILIGIDQNCCLYVMKAINTRDPVTQVSSAVLVGLFECLIATSRDSWDVLAAVKPGSAEAIQHRLRENFKKQPSSVQEMHSNALQSLDSLLAGCLNNLTRSGEGYCRSIIFLINGHLKSMMVPKSFNSGDAITADRLFQACKNLDADFDSVISSIPMDRKFFSDSHNSGHLLYLLRWCVSLATYLACVVLPCTTAVGRSFHSCNVQQIGTGLLGDSAALNAVRELLVMVKMWSNVIPGVLRECQSNAGQSNAASEKLSQLFRLLTKAYQNSLELKDLDEALLEECLSFAEVNPRFTTPKFGTGSTFDPEILFGSNHRETSSMFTQNLPLSFTFLRGPSYEAVKKRARVDSVRQLYVNPFHHCRVCSRCGNVSLSRDRMFKWPTVHNSWEMRFETLCRCGGMWRMNVSS